MPNINKYFKKLKKAGKATKSTKPTVATLAKRITAISKRDAPEVKYVDTDISPTVSATSLNGVGQGYAINGPWGAVGQGTGVDQRIGHTQKLKSLQFRGSIIGQANVTSNAYVDIYIFKWKKYSVGNTINTAMNNQFFFHNDTIHNSITPYSFRDREHMNDFQILAKRRVYMKADNYTGQTIIGQVDFKVNLKDTVYKYDTNLSNSVTGNHIYSLMLCTNGDVSGAQLTGYSTVMEGRVTYTDV